MSEIKFIIIMATFHRKNNKTFSYLTRSLNSIINQTYNNWDLIIVGDKYEPENELISIIDKFKLLTNNKIIYINNQEVERETVNNPNKRVLWNCAGANSINKGLRYARNNGYKYYCHLDDDDYWTNKHLYSLYEAYSKFQNCVFAFTKSTHITGFLPVEDMEIYQNNKLPEPCQMIHSSFSFRLDVVPFEYYTSFDENSKSEPSDSIMLSRIHRFILENRQYCSIYMPFLTCYHDEEFANY